MVQSCRIAVMALVAALFANIGQARTPADDAWNQTCFGRVYDSIHLAKHPDQLVTRIKLCFKARDDGRASDFTLDVMRRGETKSLHTSGFCLPGRDGLERGVSCNVECDGGGIYVEFRSSTGSYVLMYLDETLGIRMQECGKQERDDGTGTTLKAGKDDRMFRLDRVK